MKHSNRPALRSLTEGILHGDRIVLSQAITLIESNLPQDQKLSARLLEKIIHATGNSIRIGITGVPGVGKSSFIEALGQHITSQGKKLAVLTVDPSSQLSKGSILGDKTRMEDIECRFEIRIPQARNRKALVGDLHAETIVGRQHRPGVGCEIRK